MRSSWAIQVGSESSDVCPDNRREGRDTQSTRPCADGGRDRSNAATSQGCLEPLEAGRAARKDSPLEF